MAAALALTLALGGCSGLGFLYSNADWLATQYLASFADLDAPQSDHLHKQLSTLHRWHRAEELPHYARIVASADQMVADGLTEEGLDQLFKSSQHRISVFGERFARALAPVLATLRPPQIDTLEAVLGERNVDAVETYASPDDETRLGARRERVLERVEDWTGTLNAEQRRHLAVATDALPDKAALWLEYRQRREKELVRLMRRDLNSKDVPQFLSSWLSGK
ncbi:MAG: hypothetical protein HOI95_10930, partial [Chromatiales bacterium]|nr:hypothetical protein [Chromatiales bacterium]